MAIEFNDGVLTKAPKPGDLKTYVGINPFLEFDNKEDIPMAYRFIGMTLLNTDNYKTFRLVGGITDTDWVEVVSSSGGSKFTPIIHVVSINEMDSKNFTFSGAVGYTDDNTLVTINGINIINLSTGSEYIIIPNQTETIIEFTFPLETKDVIGLNKI